MNFKLAIISTLFLLLFFVDGYSQTNNASKPDRYYLVGTWFLESNKGNEYIVFKRKIGNQRNNSSFQIEISNNGTINIKSRKVSRRCIYDDYKKPISKALWSLDKENRLFKTTMPIIRNSKKFKIVALDIRKMILEVVESE